MHQLSLRVRLVSCFAAGGASAFDNAQHALSCGAGEVHVFVRRKVSRSQLRGAVAVAVSSSLLWCCSGQHC